MTQPTDDTTHFGFRDVPVAAKAGLVREVFDSVAGRYDLMNDLMSLGVHRLWKASFVHQVAPRAGERFIDLLVASVQQNKRCGQCKCDISFLFHCSRF